MTLRVHGPLRLQRLDDTYTYDGFKARLAELMPRKPDEAPFDRARLGFGFLRGQGLFVALPEHLEPGRHRGPELGIGRGELGQRGDDGAGAALGVPERLILWLPSAQPAAAGTGQGGPGWRAVSDHLRAGRHWFGGTGWLQL